MDRNSESKINNHSFAFCGVFFIGAPQNQPKQRNSHTAHRTQQKQKNSKTFQTMFANWKVKLSGAAAAAILILAKGTDKKTLAEAAAVFIITLFAKDHDVTGTGKK